MFIQEYLIAPLSARICLQNCVISDGEIQLRISPIWMHRRNALTLNVLFIAI